MMNYHCLLSILDLFMPTNKPHQIFFLSTKNAPFQLWTEIFRGEMVETSASSILESELTFLKANLFNLKRKCCKMSVLKISEVFES